MKKTVDFFKSPLFLPVAALLVLYGYWLLFIPSRKIFSNWDLRLGVICLTIYFIITILGKLFVNNQRLYFLPYIITVPISITGMYFGSMYLFLMLIFGLYLYRPVFLSLLGIVALVVLTYKNLVSQNKQQAIFFLTTFPIFALAVFNFVVYSPTIWVTTSFGEYKYYVVEEIYDYPHSDTDFIKCKKLSFQCDYLNGIRFARPEIIVDEQNNEVSIIDARGLIYTDGLNPRKYTGHEGGQLGSNLYYLSQTCNNFNYNGHNECESYTFVPYECKLDNTSCNPLPIEIESDYESYYYWETDEIKREINLLYSDDEILIFTYGDHPQCYVEGCKISEEK